MKNQTNLKKIAFQINKKSVNYRVGELQSIRKKIKGSKRKAASTIFVDNPKTLTDKWGYHFGGRSELQFNIGLEKKEFHFGLAFSLETSQEIHQISTFYPKIFKLNCLIREKPELFQQFKMCYWRHEVRSEITNVKEIDEDMISVGTFIFLGKFVDNENINIDEILNVFDYLLDIYLIVERKNSPTDFSNEECFTFDPTARKPAKKASYSFIQREINIDIRHAFLQDQLKKQLEKEFGKKNVSIENPINGKKIDLVVKDKRSYYFYEIKTGSCPLMCVRQAIGQLFEYAYSNGRRNAVKLFVASEHDLDPTTNRYLEYLRNEFNLPIYYKKIEINEQLAV